VLRSPSHDAKADTDPLGTGFGRATEMKVVEVEFDRGPIAATMMLYYDTKKNLEKRGVILRTSVVPPLPQAFADLPRMGCTVPPGWTRD
jgi:phytoene dehydrogenase-like protein